MKKVLLFIVVLAVAGAIGWQVYLKVQEKNKPTAEGNNRGPAVVAVETAPIGRGLIRDLGLYTGSLKPSAQFIVAPRITGRLKRLRVNIGDVVHRNQVVVELIDQEYRLMVEQAKAAVAVAEAQLAGTEAELDLAKRESGRATSLGKKAIVTQSELDTKKAKLKSAQAKKTVALAELEARRTALKEALVHLSYTRIQASWRDGSDTRVVGRKFVDEGSLLAANTPIATIIQLDPIIAVINVIERDYPKMKIGHPVELTADALPGRKFEGRIARISPVINESSRQAVIELEVPNPDRLLKPGMFIRAAIEFDRHENALVIPITALANRRDKEGIFIVAPKGDTVRFVPLKIGIRQGDIAEVLSPEISGQVVTMGHHLLADGAKIRRKNNQPAAAKPAQGSLAK